MIKIAFTSCCHFGHDPEQVTWQRIGKHQPDWLILMGDNIYMDYWPHLNNGVPLTAQEFGFDMQSKYQLQFTHPSFNKLIRGDYGKPPSILATWDDHDFAWNNSYGGGTHKFSVSADKKNLSRALFQVFLKACQTKQSAWPLQNIVELLAKPLPPEGIYMSKDLLVGDWAIRFIVLDGRYHRQPVDPATGTMEHLLGKTQCDFLRSNLLGDAAKGITRPDLAVVISGSTLRDGSEGWKNGYRRGHDEFLELTRSHGAVLVLSGDIHENKFYESSTDYPGCVEAISSGAGIKKFLLTGMCKNYGILTLDDDRSATVALYDKSHVDSPDGEYKIKFHGDGTAKAMHLLGAGAMEVTTLKKLSPPSIEDIPVGLDISVFEP